MFISGAVLYSLFQLPRVVDGFITHVQPQLGRDGLILTFMMYSYVKGALYTLIAAFVVHLLLRAYWVAMIGLDSVYANGIRWDRTNFGPIAREVYQARIPSTRSRIARLDNIASVIFSFAFLVVLLILLTIVFVAIAWGISWSIRRWILPGADLPNIFYGILAVLALPGLVTAFVDKRYGARFAPGSRAGRRLRRLVALSYHTQLIGLLGPTLLTISTNGRRRATYAMFYMMFIGALVVVMTEFMARQGLFAVGTLDWFSTRSEAHSVHNAHYESRWADGFVNDRAPSIQSDIVREPYVRLFIPYQADRHDDAVAATCPGMRPLEPRGLTLQRPAGPAVRDSADVPAALAAAAAAESANARVLACLAALHAVEVDGVSRPELRFRFAEHQRSGVAGITAFIPLAGLGPGEHVITVKQPPRSRRSTNVRPLEPYLIPFWL